MGVSNGSMESNDRFFFEINLVTHNIEIEAFKYCHYSGNYSNLNILMKGNVYRIYSIDCDDYEISTKN